MTQTDRSIEDALDAVEKNPGSIRLRADLARHLQTLGQAGLARELLDLTVFEHPLDPKSWSARAHLREADGDDTGALDDLRHALFADETNREALGHQARLLRKLGRWREARAAEAAIAAAPLARTG
ncbi:MAG: tetratricopeptide repeat protein [Pseudomonadota bacterium]